MTFPPPHPASQNSIASSTSKTISARPPRPQPSPWGIPAQTQGLRRGLAPITTNVELNSRRAGTSSSPPNNNTTSTSPLSSTFSSALNPTNRVSNSRNTSSASSSVSPFTPLQTGSQQAHTNQLLSSPRYRASTPSSNTVIATSAAVNSAAAQGGAGGSSGGGSIRNPTFLPSISQQGLSSPTITAFDRGSFTVPANSPSANNQSSVSKIVVTQIYFLLGSITEKEGKAKWDLQAEAIRKLVESNGMDVYSKYFRRLLVGNSPQIFPGTSRNVENPGNYQLLVQEMQKISQDPEQARRIAESVDTSEGDSFRDFDLSTFIDHFKLDPLSKTILALAFKQVSRTDLRTKADTILSGNFHPLLHSLANMHPGEKEVSDSLIALTVHQYIQDPPRGSISDEDKHSIRQAVNHGYGKKQMQVPTSVRSAFGLAELLKSGHILACTIQKSGPRATASLENAKAILSTGSTWDFNEEQIGGALLFMCLTLDWQQYNPSTLVDAVRELVRGRSFHWPSVVRSLDQSGIIISPDQFLSLFRALLPIATDESQFDIQTMWGGRWRYPETQLSFVLAFISLTPLQIDMTTIPRLRQAFNPSDCEDGPEAVVKRIEEARRSVMISADAVTALFDLVLDAEITPPFEDVVIVRQAIEAKVGFFLCSAIGIPRERSVTQEEIMAKLISSCLYKALPEYSFVLHSVWKQDNRWLARRLIDTHAEEPMRLPILLEHAHEHGWLVDLCSILGGFGMDLAALAHRNGLLDLKDWAREHLEQERNEFIGSVFKYLELKTQDEWRTVRKEQAAPKTVALAVKTVQILLEVLKEKPLERQEAQISLERQCFQAYPRLVNYGQGFDDIIEANGETSNALSESTEAQMQDLYKRMYGVELDIRDIIGALQEYKTSRDPEKQDLFACMIHGLFDEYVCFNDYPLEPLAKTAVLFGSVINFNLISGLTLRVGRGMVLEAVRDYGPQTSMYKFGLQALLAFIDRVHEWPAFCEQLLEIPGLQGTAAYSKLEEVAGRSELRKFQSAEPNGMNGLMLTNGDIDDFLSPDGNMQRFKSIHVDPPVRLDLYEEPNEQIQDKVLFVLNNVSEQNISVKLTDLQGALEEKHHQWFASYLVEERAKLQPNYQALYLNVLRLLNDKTLWAEVLRETYVSVQKMLNAESTMNSATERTHLKNLGSWLGSLTIARDKPVKHKNISFKELLIEGYDTQRLLIVIPFTCKVLSQATKSVVFRPPNPWTMDIIRLLVELYHFAEIKLNQKFDIEILCKDLDLDYKTVDPSTEIRQRAQLDDDMQLPMMPDGIDGFDDLSMTGINRGVRNPRLTAVAIASAMPELEPLLHFPPSSGSMINQARLRQIVGGAVQRAIMEIIAPVVERSITIATIATTNLIHKDFATEPDEDRVRRSAQKLVRALAGSLALVTCKEPLRMSMTNYIRVAQGELPDQALPEGAILMCVNDNLDTACNIVEKQAEDQSMPEIDIHIEGEITKRRRHRSEHPSEPYGESTYLRWAQVIPDPFKQSLGSLNQEQMAIYQEFARQSRGPANHTQSASMDSGRQLPDVLHEALGTAPSLPTPVEPIAMLHQPVPQQQHVQQQHGRILPPPVSAAFSPYQINGHMDIRAAQDRILALIAELIRLAKDLPGDYATDILQKNPMAGLIDEIMRLIESVSPSDDKDSVALATASSICASLYRDAVTRIEIEVLVSLLSRICQASQSTGKEVSVWLTNQEEDRLFDILVAVPLLKSKIMEFDHMDMMLSKAINNRKPGTVEILSRILDALVLTEDPLTRRASFASSLGALAQWYIEDPNLVVAANLLQSLRKTSALNRADRETDGISSCKQDSLIYLFSEWVGIYQHPQPTDKMLATFVAQLQQQQQINSKEDVAIFIRLCIESSMTAFEEKERDLQNPQDLTGSPTEAYHQIDALARLIVYLVKFQLNGNGSMKIHKPDFMNTILVTIVLILNHHHVTRLESFNQKVFFRLFSTILYEWHETGRGTIEQNSEMLLVFAHNFLLLQPSYFPGFAFAWLTLVSHRVFMPHLLKMADKQGWEPFACIMEAMLFYVSELLKAQFIAPVAKDLYRGVLRILLILHHDFPEFLAENHYRLCNIIPVHCTQLRNLLLSAYPSSFPELPDPFTAGLKVDRLDEIRKAPEIAGDFVAPLHRSDLKETVDDLLRSDSSPDEDENISRICDAVSTVSMNDFGVPSNLANVDAALLHALILYIGHSAISLAGTKGGPSFSFNSQQAVLMSKLVKELHPKARYFFLSAIANQLRYPNSHTHYFSSALLHLFGNDHADQQESDVRQQITRVLLERLIVHRPHPWGLIITLLELLKNPSYMFWDLPFIKAAPEVERLFTALFEHINQAPRNLT